jgi:hypothetical protein
MRNLNCHNEHDLKYPVKIDTGIYNCSVCGREISWIALLKISAMNDHNQTLNDDEKVLLEDNDAICKNHEKGALKRRKNYKKLVMSATSMAAPIVLDAEVEEEGITPLEWFEANVPDAEGDEGNGF